MERHFVATTYILDRKFPQTLLHFHKKLQSWLPAGGHLENNESPYEAAVREVEEETGLSLDNSSLEYIFKNRQGIQKLDARSQLLEMPYFLIEEDIAPGHIHLDWIYYAQIDDTELDLINQNENEFRWFTYHDLLEEDKCFDNVKELVFHAFELLYP